MFALPAPLWPAFGSLQIHYLEFVAIQLSPPLPTHCSSTKVQNEHIVCWRVQLAQRLLQPASEHRLLRSVLPRLLLTGPSWLPSLVPSCPLLSSALLSPPGFSCAVLSCAVLYCAVLCCAVLTLPLLCSPRLPSLTASPAEPGGGHKPLWRNQPVLQVHNSPNHR